MKTYRFQIHYEGSCVCDKAIECEGLEEAKKLVEEEIQALIDCEEELSAVYLISPEGNEYELPPYWWGASDPDWLLVPRDGER